MSEISLENLTPLMRQYNELKSKYRDCLLFFRLGDFYEMFYDDAVIASKVLNITLTSRNKDTNVPLCGVPHHSAQVYLKRLLDAGFKVAICEQLEDPAKAKGIVKRDVVRVLTPGTITDQDILEPKENNFLMSVFIKEDIFGISYADLSTGELFCAEFSLNDISISEEIREVSPKELIFSEELRESNIIKNLKSEFPGIMFTFIEREKFNLKNCRQLLIEHFKGTSVYGPGIEDKYAAISAVGACLFYLIETQKGNIGNITSINFRTPGESMIIDEATRRNLEVFVSMMKGNKEGTLIEIIDRTETAMGGRLLRKWLLSPLQNKNEIVMRQDAVTEMCDEPLLREKVRDALSKINDIERLLSKAMTGSITPKDVVALRESLRFAGRLKELLSGVHSQLLVLIKEEISGYEELLRELDLSITDDPPVHLKDGMVIRKGYNKELDDLRTIAYEGQKWIANLEAGERKRTGINSLKVGYNRVFGYYIEVTRPNLHLVPQNYIRKQSLANAERFITEELKNFEEKVLTANEKIIELESALFNEVRNKIINSSSILKKLAKGIASIDVIVSLADVAVTENYTRPVFVDTTEIKIKDGRHPVIEKYTGRENFIPNDILLDNESNQILIITGPNMAGKSTVIRQVGLIVLLAHIGSFVPASEVRLGIVDRLFARVGAMDELARGRSTFMVEMQETAYILRQATKRSLILLDEIGRGTATFDGISIAWAVAEYIHDTLGTMTLFATHYHELTELALTKERIKNWTISVREWNDKIIFLRKLIPGGANRSFGIQVGKLAGLPEDVVIRAREILTNLEKGEFDYTGKPRIAKRNKDEGVAPSQLTFFTDINAEIIEELKKIDIDSLTPIDALNILNDLKKKYTGQ
jgi:DNA mismatch repair protein MutS